MLLIAQDLDECILIKLADVDDGRAQWPPSSRLRSQSPIELLLGDEPSCDQDITKLAPIDSEHVFSGEAVRGLVPTGPLTCPHMIEVTKCRRGHDEIVAH